MFRMIGEFFLAALFNLLAILTEASPRWIETVFRLDPDHGNGALEWMVVMVFAALALIAAGLGSRAAVIRARARA